MKYIKFLSKSQENDVKTSVDNEILQDPKNLTWKENKSDSRHIAESYKRLSKIDNKYLKKYSLITQCCDYLEFKEYEYQDKKLHRAFFCKDRLCPICSKRRSIIYTAQFIRVFKELEQLNYRFLFLTLTAKNVVGDKLAEQISYLLNSFHKFSRKTKFKKAVKGFLRSLEVTRNIKDGTYHPHIHLVLVVSNSYFKNNNKDYITQKEFVRLWQDSLNADYKPVVDVRAVKKQKEDREAYIKMVLEVVKYSVKTSDIIVRENNNLQDNIIYTLDNAFSGRRFLGLGGIVRKLYKELGLKDVDEMNSEEMIHNLDESNKVLDFVIVTYSWLNKNGFFNYYKTDTREATEEDIITKQEIELIKNEKKKIKAQKNLIEKEKRLKNEERNKKIVKQIKENKNKIELKLLNDGFVSVDDFENSDFKLPLEFL